MKLSRLVLPLCLAALIAVPAFAGSTIEIAHPWARSSLPNRPGAAYLMIQNTGDAADRLIAASAVGVGKIELHKVEKKNDVMMMMPVEAIDVPAGGMAELMPELKRGAYHLMLFDIAQPLKVGDSLDMTLSFESAGRIRRPDPPHRAGREGHGRRHAGRSADDAAPAGQQRRLTRGYAAATAL